MGFLINCKDLPDYPEQYKLIINEIHASGLKTVFLDGGTLLGAIREGKFIDHDKDTDVGCYYSDFKVWKKDGGMTKCVESLRKKGYSPELNNEQTLKFRRYLNGKRYKLDIFAFVRAEGYYWHKGFGGVMTYPLECLDTLVPYKFYEEDMLIPNEVEKFLVNTYGPNWRVPNLAFKGLTDYTNLHTLQEMQDLLNKYNQRKQE